MNLKFTLIFVGFVINLSTGDEFIPEDYVLINATAYSALSFEDKFAYHHAIVALQHRWKDGRVHYELDEKFDDHERLAIGEAMTKIEDASCIRFVPLNEETNNNFVKIRKDYASQNDADGDIGCMYEGQQNMWIGSRIRYDTAFHHILLRQFLMLLGFYHHFRRSDRDEYMNFHFENSKVGDDDIVELFTKFVDPDPEIDFATPFDVNSVLMEDLHEISSNGLPVSTFKNKYMELPSREDRQSLSFYDRILLNVYYDCHIMPIDDLKFKRDETSEMSSIDVFHLHHAFTTQNMLWRYGQVNYQIDGKFDAYERYQILDAMDEIEKSSCIIFVPYRSAIHIHYVRIHKDDENRRRPETDIGCLQKGQQNMRFSFVRSYYQDLLQQLLHTLGFFGHHARSDRDKYIEFYVEDTGLNDSAIKSHFAKLVDQDPLVEFITPFDFDSVMLYDEYTYDWNEWPYISSKIEHVGITNNREKRGLSISDKILLNTFYNCPIKPEDTVMFKRNQIRQMSSTDKFNLHHGFVLDNMTWPDGVYYMIDASFTDFEKNQIHRAMEEIEQSSCVRFYLFAFVPKQFVKINKDYNDKRRAASDVIGCTSNSGQHDVWFGSQLFYGDDYYGDVLRVLLHVLGFTQHFMRSDRDKYIEIHMENGKLTDFNIPWNYRWNFQKLLDPDPTFKFLTPFDFDSVMMDDLSHLSVKGKPLITSKVRYKNVTRSRFKQSLSKYDKILINKFYNCPIEAAKRIDYVQIDDVHARLLTSDELFNSHNAFTFPSTLWENGYVNYKIEKSFTAYERATIVRAMDDIEASSCIIFVPIYNFSHLNFVAIKKDLSDSGTAHGDVGCLFKGEQSITFGYNRLDSPNSYDTILHELLHAVGFYHHHQRSDRDKYIDLNLEHQSLASITVNYAKVVKPDPMVHFLTPFDFHSTMLYGSYMYSTVITTKNGSEILHAYGDGDIGLSEYDKLLINKFYDCPIKALDGVIFNRNKTKGMHDDDVFNLHHAFTLEENKWDDKLIIYDIDKQFNGYEMDMIRSAMHEIQNSTCIRFVQYNSTTDSHVHFVKIHKVSVKPGIPSIVGCKHTGQQPMYFGFDIPFGMGFHHTRLREFLHTLGFFHHHMRSDRDQYIKFHMGNTNLNDSDISLSFQKLVDPDLDVKFLTKFDFDSVMMYGSHELSLTSKPFITSNSEGEGTSTRGLSTSDKILINKFYKCPDTKNS